MKWLLAVVIVLLAPAVAAAEDGDREWTAGDTALQAVFVAFVVADWSQSMHGARHPEKYQEQNRLMEGSPTGRRVTAVMAAEVLAHTAVAVLLPKPYRTAWQAVWIMAEADTINHNRGVGIGLSLHF